jgi:fructokinase
MRIGVDIGGSKIEIQALDEAGRVCLRRRQPTPHNGYNDAVGKLAGLILGAEREVAETCSVGIGMPGAIDPRTGVVKNSHNTPFNGSPLKADLERLLARKVRIENDANCLALSEAIDGAARGYRLSFAAVLGTGAGGGIVHAGRILPSANGLGGEWGHNPLPWMQPGEFPGPECYCGRRGCIEQFVSGPALAAAHAEAAGTTLEPAAICALADAGDTAARASMARYAQRLARALAHVINLLDPEVIVLGGGLSNLRMLYRRVPEFWKDFAYGGGANTPLVPAAHGDASGVRGAARLWDTEARVG